ncbi:Hypothetical protein CINCED_3A021298 [Cinara cedri]|uniref:Uncharacterized protein n=1 Tax=Cinara cedri TaxID=506608 RepID=A0A5E4MLW7_9HEMI|nr:Hypothetical protein CINCED_3A021298 [Cinara cedri]
MFSLLASTTDLNKNESADDLMSCCSDWLSPDEDNILSESGKDPMASDSKSTNVKKNVGEMKVPPKKIRKVMKPAAAGQPVKLKAARPVKPKVAEPVKPKVAEPVKPKVAEPVKPKVAQPVKLASAIKSHVNLPKDPYAKLLNAEYPDPWSYKEYNGIPYSLGSKTVILGRKGSYDHLSQCDSYSAGIGVNTLISPEMAQQSHHGDGENATNKKIKNKPSGRFRADHDVDKTFAKQSLVNKRPHEATRVEPFQYLWSVADNAFKSSPPKQSKLKKISQIVTAYNAPPGGNSRKPVQKSSNLVGPTVSSSYINRQKQLKETETKNKLFVSKVLRTKPAISSFRKFCNEYEAFCDSLVLPDLNHPTLVIQCPGNNNLPVFKNSNSFFN